MLFRLFLLLLLSVELFAYTDSDMDGVEDRFDKCPNTPFMELVDESGCSVASIVPQYHLSVMVGINYDSDKVTQTAELDYMYHSFSFRAYGAFDYKTTEDESGFNDTAVWGYYLFDPLKSLHMRVGAGVIRPAYQSEGNKNRLDYSATLTADYEIGNFDIFGGYTYTLVGAKAPKNAYWSYRNTNSVYIGSGYSFDALYSSFSYSYSQSIYKGSKAIQTISMDIQYNINLHWFVTANYTNAIKGLDTRDFLSLQIGYNF